jgi:hypothetical protein
MDSKLSDALSCSICMVHFDDSKHTPRTLRCHHTFCQLCMRGLAEQNALQKIVCPKCREQTPVQDSDVSKLFCNYQLLEAADADVGQVRAAAAGSDVTCEVCDDEQHAATHRCAECAEFMCQPMAKAHSKMKASRDHDVQTMAEFKASGASPGKVANRTVYCSAHPSPSVLHELTLFCKTCDVAICRDCIIKDHKQPDHDVVFLEEVIAEQRGVMTAMVGDAELRAGTVGEAIAAIEEMQQSVTQREGEGEAAIKRSCQEVCAAARAHEARMLVALKGGCALKKKALGVQTEALSTFKLGLDSSCEYVRKALSSGSDAQVMHAKPLLLGRLRELQQQECVMEPAATDHVWLDTDTRKVLSALGGVCVPTFPAAVAERCVVEGAGAQGHPVVGAEAEFTVVLADAEGERVVLPGDADGAVVVQVRAEAEAEAGAGAGAGGGAGARSPEAPAAAVAVAVAVAHNGDGSFTCKYTPADASALRISVRVFGQPVPGSPFVVRPAPLIRHLFTSLFDGVTASADKTRVTSNMASHRWAIATPALAGPVAYWRVKIHNMGGRWVLAGAIGAASHKDGGSYSAPTCFGWAASAQVWVAGADKPKHDGWAGDWKTGDEPVFQLDVAKGTLAMWHARLGRRFTIEGLPAGQQWHIHVNLHGAADSLETCAAAQRAI